MSLLSDFLPKPFAGLTTSADTLAFSKAAATLLIAATDVTAGGANYPLIVARNAYQAAGSGGELRFECRNTTPTDFVAAKIKGSLSTLTAGAEVGQLDLLAMSGGSYRGLVIKAGALLPGTNATETLGASARGFGALYLHDGFVQVSITPGASTTLAFNGTAFQVASTGKTYNLGVSNAGVTVFNNQNPSDALLAIGYTGSASFYSQSAGTTGYGIKLDYGIPSSQTAAAIGLSIDMTQATASFTTTNVYGVKLGGWSSGSGASVDNAYGLYIDSLGINATLKYGIRIAGTHNYALHCLGAGPILLSSTTVTDDVNAPALGGIFNVETVSTGLGSYPAMWVEATDTSYGPTTALAVFNGPDVGTYGLILAKEAATGTTAFSVAANGVTIVGNSGQLSSAKFSVAGRIASNGNDSYDLAGATLAADAIIVSTHSVGVSKYAQMLRLEGTMSLSGSGGEGYGLASIQTASTHAMGSLLHGVYTKLSTAGGGTATGVTIDVTATAGHTGLIRGILISTTSQAGSASTGIQVQHSGGLGYGLHIEALAAGATLVYGCYVGYASSVVTAAYAYQQRAGSTADAFLYREATGTDRFRITSAGDVTMGGTSRRFKADMDSTGASRFAFQTTTASATTLVAAVPSSGGSQAGFMAHDAADMDNAARVILYVNNTAAVLTTSQAGTGVTRALQLQIVTTTCLQIHTNTDVVLGPGSMATGSTAGFPYLPTCAGNPSGAATSRAGFAPIIVDETTPRFYVRVGSTWRYATLT